jgi:transcriptional regulator with XRE-family HTH domain
MRECAIKAVLARRGLRQKDLAELLGISPATTNEKIRGKSEFKESEINKLIEITGMNYEEIFLSNDFEKLEMSPGD